MKTVILAGGLGTRISEESHLRPKPMIEIGGLPILWHIMKTYSHYGYNDFIICAGYKQHIIKEYFANYYLRHSDVTFDFADKNKMFIHENIAEPYRVTIVDTGLNTMTGGRIRRIRQYIGDETFMLTYGDGVADIDVAELVRFHKSHGKIATMTAINFNQRFGVLNIDGGGKVRSFREKENRDGGTINGGFMVLNKEVFDLLGGDDEMFEKKPLETLAERGELMAYRHGGFWQCMDTQRDKVLLDELWDSGNAPWKKW